MAERPKNRALVYLRRSTSRQEASLETQLQWAIAEATRMAVALEAAPADLERMQAGRLHTYRDIRLDDGITGADLRRPGFLALRRDAIADPAVSHLFIYRRDRLARPEDCSEMVLIEKSLLLAGLTIVFRDGVSEPMQRGQVDVGRELGMFFGYYESGEFLRKLAERVISAQRLLAEGGYRTGGNAPYGFGRVLVDAAGTILQELPPGRTARQPGCHVRIAPRDDQKVGIWLLILELKEAGWGIKRIARHLNGLGIPSPGAGTTRTDQGVKHTVSGKWCGNTVKELCANRAVLGLQDYGRRSEGAHRRLGDAGPRLLTDADRLDETRTRVVMNDASVRISAVTGSEPRFDPARWQEIQRRSEERGRAQRGVPRAPDPARYPLSCRLVDLTDGCGSILYGLTHGGRALYKCGRYMRTEGAECRSNAVDAEAMLRFTLRTIRQLIDRHGNRDRLRTRLEERARQGPSGQGGGSNIREAALEARLAELKGHLEIVGRRMAIERDDARYAAIAREYDRLHAEVRTAEAALESGRYCPPTMIATTIQDEVEAAMGLLEDLDRITSDEGARADVHPLLERLGLRIGLSFGSAIKGKKRVVQRLLGGVMAFGGAPLPVRLHGASNLEGPDPTPGCVPGDAGLGAERGNDPTDEGHEARRSAEGGGSAGLMRGESVAGGDRVPAHAVCNQDNPIRPMSGRREGISITKVNRGDRI
jgi:DNA invertase Pin-like site-specific DNA recombinase